MASLSRRLRGRLLWLTAGLWVAASFTGCTTPKPVSYPMGNAFGFGSFQMSVGRTEAFTESSRKALSVHVMLDGITNQQQGVQTLLSNRRFDLVDGSNTKYKCLAVMPTDYFYKSLAEVRGDFRGAIGWGNTWMENHSSAPIPKNWVLLFEVPLDAKGFTLSIDNAKAKNDQPRYISVRLDR